MNVKHFWYTVVIAMVFFLGLISIDAKASPPAIPDLHFSELQADEVSGTEFYTLTGQFTEKSILVIRKFLMDHPEEVNIALGSNGGYANDLSKIVALIQSHGRVNFFSQNGNCLSACAIMASAGQNSWGWYHFHGIHRLDGQGTKVMALDANFEMIKILRRLGWDEWIAARAMEQDTGWMVIYVPMKDNPKIDIMNEPLWHKVKRVFGFAEGYTMAKPMFRQLMTQFELMGLYHK